MMNISRPKLNRLMLKSISAFLVLWLSSVLVLVCCNSYIFTTSAMNDAESCPMGKGHECCKKNNDSNKVSGTESDQGSCCIFKPSRTLSADLQNVKIIKQEQSLAAAQGPFKFVYLARQTYPPPPIYHPAIRNRGSTYLQNCVFRI